MIGKIMTGKSFRGCISYCLENKKNLSAGIQVTKNRAEVLCYNLCYGSKTELINQFKEVQLLNPKLSKPVMHVTLSFSPGEDPVKPNLIAMVEECAKDLGFAGNQYLAIAHNDTNHAHLHIVVNKIGLDGKTLKDSHNYRQIANYCRRMEERHGLKKVLNPKRYLPKSQQQLPRMDERKQVLRNNIKECLANSYVYSDFEKKINAKGYSVVKARGISFLDKQKVKVKGSEVGYSLKTIEKILAIEPSLRKQHIQMNEIKEDAYKQISTTSKLLPTHGAGINQQNEALSNEHFVKRKKRKRLRL